MRTTIRRFLAALATVTFMVALASCADSGTAPPLPGSADTSRYDAVIAASPVADPAAITPGSWADKVRQRGTLNVGGTDAGPLFSLKDPATGKVTGFDAGLSQMLAHYITGKPTDNTALTITTVDTRETLLENGTVDAVFATYTITPQRAAKVAFAGPYYSSGDAIMVKADNTTIRTAADLNGRTVATQANSTAVLALQKAAPGANVLLFQEDAQCVAAVQQGRADAYVIDQGILISDASTNPAVKVVGEPFSTEPYGIGLPLNDPTAKAFVNDWLEAIYADGSWANLWKATIGTVVSGDPPAPPAIGSVEGS
ncbi:glutamate ABC transporter substrate-binding protein [Pseudonocardia xinjiangensis]|uniref:Glutamate ABC transporter substrate-binding protein n=1 Tax=Pseudonocardia xinjiangensis TaxID=75289 RepID=A0ABX1RBX0_9PSEU|nr:glutamate ABC transporter substrate-binding protein [Pseudonocardia xinjiangensis]NMH76610.1 glutamate ABC transporter substrate-binding protein [Pseudonocardia xinjiangensis]